MDFENYIRQWAFLCESEENRIILKESLSGNFTNKDVANSFSKMIQSYRTKLLKAVLVNDRNFINTNYSIDGDVLNFRTHTDYSKRTDAMRLEKIVDVLNENPDKEFRVDDKKVIEIHYDIDDSDGSIIPCIITEKGEK